MYYYFIIFFVGINYLKLFFCAFVVCDSGVICSSTSVRVKVKFTLEQATKAQRGAKV
jgi:hypothetical protein